MDRSTKFWNRMAKRYSEKPISDEASYQKKLEVTRQYLKPEMDVLELGCGTGSTALIHAPYVHHILATDFSENMINIARKKGEDQGITNVTFQCSSVDDINVPDESLDVVLALSVLHLLKDKEQAIAKVYKMLKPGGIFVSSTVCIMDGMKFFSYIAPIGRWLGFFPLVKSFTGDDMRQSMTQAGFDIHYDWRPGKDKALFLIVKKPLCASGG